MILWASGAAAGPVAFRVSGPTRPGETALIYGDGLSAADEIRVIRLGDQASELPRMAAAVGISPKEGIAVKPLQPVNESVKFVVPAALTHGVFAVSVHSAAGWSRPLFLNRADPWWAQGDRGTVGTPGGWVMVFGSSLELAPAAAAKPRIALIREQDHREFLLEPDAASPYSIRAKIPDQVSEGAYSVWAHNGFGGERGWASGGSIDIERPRAWPQRVFDVKAFGASGDGSADDTAPVLRALEAAGQAGGGIVFFPRGFYRIARTLEVPRETVLRGEREDLVDLFWATTDPSPLPAVIRGTSRFAIEDLTLHFSLASHGIVADGASPDSGEVALRRVRARWLLYSGHLEAPEAHQRFSDALQYSTGGGDLLRLAGHDIEITDCDLYSSGRVFAFQNVVGARISGNVLHNGRRGWYNLDGGERIIFQNNEVVGGDLMSTGGSVSTYRFPSSRFIYFGDNRLHDLYGWDREAITTDGGGGDTVGPIARADAKSIEYPSSQGWKKDDLKDRVAYVLAGKGKGQYRRIVANDDRSVSVDTDWDVLPDLSSVVGITWMRGRYLFVRNDVVDAGISVQLYGVAFDSIVAENRSVRAGGFRSFAARYLGNYNVPLTQGIQPQMFVQYLDNQIVEGSSYHMGGDEGSFLELIAGPPSAEWKWPIAFGFVFRGNRLDSWSRLRLVTSGEGPALIEDVIIEKNPVRDSPPGIEIGPRVARILVFNRRGTAR